MNIKQVIVEEVKTILSEGGFGEGDPPKGEWYKKQTIVVEEEGQNIIAQLDQIVDEAPQVIPELEKFVNDNLINFLKKSLEGSKGLSEADEELSDKIAEPMQKAIKGAGQVAKGVAKGTAPISIPALKLAGHVGSFLPFGKKAGVLIAAAQDKNTPEAVRNAILFALANLLAGQLGMDIPDLSSLIQMVPGVPDFESAVLHSIDDMTLLAWAWRKMKKAGVDPKEQLKRFGEFIGRADLVDLGDDPTAVPGGPEERGIKEMKIKTSDLYRIIQEELEVVLTNEEAEEIFNLDMSALLDEMMNEKALTSNERDDMSGSDFIFPDGKHFPIPDESHARNAWARANQFDPDPPKWYKGSLTDFVEKVHSAVTRKFPDIDIDPASTKPGKG